jgi:hypothetical protein
MNVLPILAYAQNRTRKNSSVCIKFCLKPLKGVTVTLKMLKPAFGEQKT